MTTTLYLLTLMLPLATILIIFAMRYVAAIQQARARLAHDDAYRQLAQTASSAEVQIVTTLAAIEANLSDVRTRMAAMEAILKAVE